MSHIKRTALGLALALLAFVSSTTHAALITQWTFEGDVLTPSTGSGTASNIGGTSSAFATGNGGGRGWNTSAYPAQGTNSGTAGVRFDVSTVGFADIIISFDHRASGTASRWARLDYTTDGGSSWITFGNNGGGLSPHDTFYPFTFDLSAISGVNNNANFGFRIVSIFSPLAFDQNATLPDFAADTAYMRANADASFTPGGGVGTGNYGPTGTWRFDNVTVSGTPEPSTMALLGVVLAALGGMRLLRRRQKKIVPEPADAAVMVPPR